MISRRATHAGVGVRYASRRGPNAADDRIRELVDELGPADIEVVTSDRALRDDVREKGSRTVGAGTFLGRLDRLGC